MKLFFTIVLAIFALLAGFIAVLPTLLSIPEIHSLLLQRIAPKLHLKALEASWFEGLLIQGIEIKDPPIQIHSIYWREPLYKLLFLSEPLEKIAIQGFKMKIAKDAEIAPLVGDTVEADLTLTPKSLSEGLLDGTVTSPNLTAKLACLIKDNTLTLREPVVGTFLGTPNPAKFWIDPQGFSVPLAPFSLKGIVIQSMKVEPDKQSSENRGLMALVLSLLKASLSAGQRVNIWFTPIFLSLKDSIVQVQRFDFLFADRYPLAAWGEINLENNNLLMTLGVSSKAIEKAFFIISTGSNKFVQIPIRGTIDSPTFDVKRATTKITALRLQQTLSPPTIIFGTLLKAASTIGEDDTPVPLPTTQPFPWKE